MQFDKKKCTLTINTVIQKTANLFNRSKKYYINKYLIIKTGAECKSDKNVRYITRKTTTLFHLFSLRVFMNLARQRQFLKAK